jgi:hypothetical protein
MKYIITESRMVNIIKDYLIMEFPSFEKTYYNWADFNCGMGVCCDMYAIGFTLPEDNYDDYLFKLVDSVNYKDSGNYKNYPDELPEPCYESPNIHEERFDEYIITERMCEPFENFFGSMENWGEALLNILNHKFKTNVKIISSDYNSIEI